VVIEVYNYYYSLRVFRFANKALADPGAIFLHPLSLFTAINIALNRTSRVNLSLFQDPTSFLRWTMTTDPWSKPVCQHPGILILGIQATIIWSGTAHPAISA
jgi:hypothetical protein